MTSWILDAVGGERLQAAESEAGRRRLSAALSVSLPAQVGDQGLRDMGAALELQVSDLLIDETGASEGLRSASARAFALLRSIPRPADPVERAAGLLRLSCLALIGDRGADARRILQEEGIPELALDTGGWGERVWRTTLDTWLRIIRKRGWEDLDRVHGNVLRLREAQSAHEPSFLASLEELGVRGPAWQLVAQYHLAKAAEDLAVYLTQGVMPDGRFDVHEKLQSQFDRALSAAARGHLIEFDGIVRLLARAAAMLVDNSIWTVTRAVNSRVTRFVEQIVSRERRFPLFEMLPPQRRTLREEGLLGSGHRSVVVSLPTSSGKTLIAQFRVLQALNQFDQERGWVAYIAPTRALVKQVAVRLRRDFEPLNIAVECVSPALEVDGVEGAMLKDSDPQRQVRVLVTTWEKLDLMIRGGWEREMGRPLTLVVVDEAHNLGSTGRGIKLELLLATINRECRYAQFLLLTPFIGNAPQIARWLDPGSHKNVELAFDWTPNDRVVAIAEPVQGQARGAFRVVLSTIHTSKHTLAIPEDITLSAERPLGLSWSDVKGGQGALAAATAHQLRSRGTVIVLADKPRNTWGLAQRFKVPPNRRPRNAPEIEVAKLFLAEEFGSNFELTELLDYGVGVHHAGLSDDAKALVEWLTEQGHLDILVATTTIAQGVNFPVSGVVLASHQYPYGVDMSPEDFWNIAGRAGRVDQGDIGVVVLAAAGEGKRKTLEAFVRKSVGDLNSTLIDMVLEANAAGQLLQLEQLSWQPQWSAFLQYLAHTYRQFGEYEQFAVEVEQVLRGTFGFQALRRSQPNLANKFVQGVLAYGRRLVGKPLALVDSTGFSWESVSNTLGRLSDTSIDETVWKAELFDSPRPHLQTMMGLLLQIPELRENLEDVVVKGATDGDTLARVVCDWVQGRSLQQMAATYFAGGAAPESVSTDAMTRCCQSVFGRVTQTASWGLAALQTLTFPNERFETLGQAEQRALRNLPARVYYGVNSDAALTMRMAGVPRSAAGPLAGVMRLPEGMPISQVRARLRGASDAVWRTALGDMGPAYRRVWQVVEGE